MVKPQCSKQLTDILNIRDDFASHLNEYMTFHSNPTFMKDLAEPRKKFIAACKEEGSLTSEQEEFYKLQFSLITAKMLTSADIGDITEDIMEVKDKLLALATESFAECECGEFTVKTGDSGPWALPIVTYQGKQYYVDRRVNEMRNVDIPWDTVSPIPEQELSGTGDPHNPVFKCNLCLHEWNPYTDAPCIHYTNEEAIARMGEPKKK